MADTRTYATTPEKLQALATMLASHGVTIDPTQPSGEEKADGWDIQWTSPAPGQTAFTVVKHPFAEEGILWGKLGGVLGPSV